MAERGKNPDGIHNGHRRRIMDRYTAKGLYSLKEHERLEIMLFSMDPRKDMDYVAKSLIERFGSIFTAITADIGELAAVDGVGEVLAMEIGLLGELYKMYVLQELSDSED